MEASWNMLKHVQGQYVKCEYDLGMLYIQAEEKMWSYWFVVCGEQIAICGFTRHFGCRLKLLLENDVTMASHKRHRHEFNVADLRWNACIGKVFQLIKLYFSCNMEHNFYIRAIFSYYGQNRNRDWKSYFESLVGGILHMCIQLYCCNSHAVISYN